MAQLGVVRYLSSQHWGNEEEHLEFEAIWDYTVGSRPGWPT